jgi:ribosomal protein L40E
MKRFHIGIPKWETLPKPPFFLVSDCLDLHYNGGSLDCFSPPDTMPSNRHNLILDEQAFQGLLSAAFVVQEYNDRLRNNRLDSDRQNGDRTKPARQQRAEPEAHPAAESPIVCRHCGAEKPAEESRCESCGWEEFRPGERLQRNWASMWLMSQEQDLWPGRSAETRESAGKDVPPPPVDRRPLPHSGRDSASSGLVARPVASEIHGQGRSDTIHDAAAGRLARDTSAFDKPKFHKPLLDDQALGNPASDAQAINQAEAESKSTTAAIDETTDEATDHWIQEGFAHEDSDLAVHTFEVSASDDALPIEASADESADLTTDATDAIDPGNRSLLQHWADLRVTLRFHRSDLYLGGAVLVAALALLWPAAGSPRRPVLSPWERALVTLGLAEAPEPAVHVQGDPAIEVWVDPHTALYYCPGEEQYGKTADGRLSSQHEAQMDRFEPAGHLACD